MPLVKVEWIGPDEYGIAVSALIAAGRKKVSLVDHLSFTLMRRSPIVLAFAYDRHFLREGFHLLR